MFRSFALTPRAGGRVVRFEIDLDTGDVRGEDAEMVEDLLDRAREAGEAIGDPHPTRYAISEPRRSLADLAVALGGLYVLPVDLARAHPRPPDDDESSDIEPTY